MPSAEVFLDTNVLLYACSSAPADTNKQKRAVDLIQNSRFGLSSQVLQEFLANALRKSHLGISESQIDATLALAAEVPVVPISLDLIVSAVDVRRRFGFSQWDSSIVAAARILGCHTLYTEDLQHSQTIDGLTILNPFIPAP